MIRGLFLFFTIAIAIPASAGESKKQQMPDTNYSDLGCAQELSKGFLDAYIEDRGSSSFSESYDPESSAAFLDH